MSEKPRDDEAVQLDPRLTSKPFDKQTKWIVITGTSCSGKTTLINQLTEMGYTTVPEVARTFFDEQLAKGRTIHEIRSDMVSLERTIMDLQIRFERALHVDDLVFLDRGLPDILTFFRFAGADPNEILPECFHYQYAAVLVLDPLPIERDGIRIEGHVLRDYLDAWLPRDYSALGYSVIRVPVMSPEDRLRYVLAELSAKGTINGA